MHEHMRTIAAMGFLGAVTMGLTPLGCTSRLGPVRASQTEGRVDHPNVPDITLARASDCVAEYGSQLEPGRHRFDAKVYVDEDGDKEDVTIDDIPNTAYDLGACMRNALRAMPIAEEPLRQGVATLKYRREHPNAAERSLTSSPIVVVVAGVTIVVSELVLEAGAYTIVFAVTVKVVDKAGKEVADVLRRIPRIDDDEDEGQDECLDRYVRCMGTHISRKDGNHWKESRCGTCRSVCQRLKSWPTEVGNGSCEYWNRDWGR
ncbi:MAG: hypothetical protein IPM54_02570 [Polyangiaceae bacterium]|nr:hypothetical protein [Polyangiaceae bacterium]